QTAGTVTIGCTGSKVTDAGTPAPPLATANADGHPGLPGPGRVRGPAAAAGLPGARCGPPSPATERPPAPRPAPLGRADRAAGSAQVPDAGARLDAQVAGRLGGAGNRSGVLRIRLAMRRRYRLSCLSRPGLLRLVGRGFLCPGRGFLRRRCQPRFEGSEEIFR